MYTDVNIINKNFVDLNPLSFGYESCSKGHHFGPYVRNDFIIHYVVSGKGEFSCPKGKYKVRRGEIFIIHPNEVSFYKADEDDPWEYIWISFTGARAERLFNLGRVLPLASRVFMDMKECADWQDVKEEFLASKLHLLFAELFIGTVKKDDYVRQVTDYIDSRYMISIKVDDIAASMNLNRSYLSKLFAKKMNISIQQYIIETRLKNAVNLLKQGVSVSNTANSVGYADPFTFSKIFKKKMGVSPKHYYRG